MPLFKLEAREAPKPEKPPIEKMLEARAPVEQIAQVYGLEESEVYELALAHGVDLTQPRHIIPANEGVAQQEAVARQEQRARVAAAKAKATQAKTAAS